MSHRRVLVASLYASWHYHSAIEITLAHALRGRGAEVLQVACDGQFGVCDVYRENLNPRPRNGCVDCQARSIEAFRKLAAPLRWLGNWISPALRREVAEWAAGLDEQALETATWRGHPIGAWALSSALYQYRRSSFEADDASGRATLRAQVAGCALAAGAFDALYSDWQPDALVLLNGRFFAHRAAFELARQRGIRVHVHERGGLKDTLTWRSGVAYQELEPLRALWAARAELPLRTAELALVQRTLSERRQGQGMSWSVRYSPPPEAQEDVRRKLALDARPIVALFTSSDDEQATFPDYRVGAFPCSLDWLPASVALARRMPERQFVIRLHPGLVSFGTNDQTLRRVEELALDLPENCRLVRPKDDISSYTLADMAELGIVYYTTLGMEMAARGQQVVCVAKGWYSHGGFCRYVERPEDYEAGVRTACDAAARDGRSVEIARRAHRFLHHYFGDLSLPFPLVHEEPMGEGKPSWRRTSQLLPQQDPVLDRLCAAVLHDEPVFPHQRPDDATRDPADEQRYFGTAEFAQSPHAAGVRSAAEQHFLRGDYAAAARLLRELVQHEPAAALAWNDLGVVLCAAGDLPGALASVERARELAPDAASPRVNLARLYAASGRTHEARAEVRSVLARDPSDAEAVELQSVLGND
jgi:tetratricopeptide (TPR) repeat protein